MLSLEFVLNKALGGDALLKDDLVRLLSPQNDAERGQIAASAREIRSRNSGSLIFTYGFVYLSTACRNDCRFCGYRAASKEARRYRKTSAEVLAAAQTLAAQGVNLIDLTMGEDPASDEPHYIAEIAELIGEVKKATDLPVMISPGVAQGEALAAYHSAGAHWYACYQETYNEELFSSLRPKQSFDLRQKAKKDATAQGFLVEEGILCGVGETLDDLADSILAMGFAHQVRAMGFVPPSEALGDDSGRWLPEPQGQEADLREIDMIAALRLAWPDRLIPASLDVEGLAGLAKRLNAGANVITSLVPASLGLSGVAQADLDVDNEARSIAGVRPVVDSLGLKLATPAEYCAWLKAI